MRASGTILGGDVRTLDVKGFDGRSCDTKGTLLGESDSRAAARFRSAPSISSGGPVITVGKQRVTPVEAIA